MISFFNYKMGSKKGIGKCREIFTLRLYEVVPDESNMHYYNEARDIDCICCRELDAMLIASAKIPERQGRISSSSFYGHLPDY